MKRLEILEPEIIEIETTHIVIDHNTSKLASAIQKLKSTDYSKDETINIFSKVFSILQSFGLIFFILDASLITLLKYDMEVFTYLPLEAHALICKTAIICAIFTGLNALFSLYKTLHFKPKFDRKTILNNSIEIILLAIALIYTIISTFVQIKTNPCYYASEEILLEGNPYNKEGLLTILMYAMIFLTAFTLRNEKHRQLIIASMFINAYASIIIMIIMGAANGYVQNDFLYYRLVSNIFNNSNHFGYFACVITMLSAGSIVFSKKNWHILVGTAFFVPSFLCLLVSQTLGSNLGFIGGLVFIIVAYIVKNKKFSFKIVWLLVLAAIVFAISESTNFTNMSDDYSYLLGNLSEIKNGAEITEEAHTQNSTFDRWYLLEETLKCMKQSPWIGKGLDCYYEYNYINPNVDMPHNEYIQIASNVGIPVMVFYISAIIIMFVRAIKNRKGLSNTTLISLGIVFAYLISAFFGNTFIYTYPYFLIFFAFAIPVKRKEVIIPENTYSCEYV